MGDKIMKNRHRLRSKIRNGLSSITPLELRIIELMGIHDENNEVAEHLGFSEQKLNVMKKDLYKKTGCIGIEDLKLYKEVYLMSKKNQSRKLRET